MRFFSTNKEAVDSEIEEKESKGNESDEQATDKSQKPNSSRYEKKFKVHLTPNFFCGRDETVQHSHKDFDNFISVWYF